MCKKLFKDRFNIEASDKDCEVIRRVCEAVSTRAARLTAAGIVAIVKKIDITDGCTVAVEYSLHPQFLERYYSSWLHLGRGVVDIYSVTLMCELASPSKL